jgi:iron(III) transport system ATP-binding protein
MSIAAADSPASPVVPGAIHAAGSESAPQEPYLVLKGIHKSFGSFVALQNIDLEIPKGEFVCFLGPSGCGKTTLLRIIAGLEKQSAGTITQGGRDITALAPTKRDYGIVFQSYALFPNMTVHDNVSYGLVNRRMRRDDIATRVEELLKLIGLPNAGPKYPNHLSGGEQQRVALARALATSPGLLLLDEPLSALDAIVRIHLRHEIRALQQRLGVTTIMVTHDQEEALTMADRIVVMNHGVINQVGSPLAVYREPATPFAANFVGKVNTLDAVVEGAGRVRIGQCSIACALAVGAPGRAIRVYLRPEDIVPGWVAAAGEEAVDATIEKIDFHGSYCLARVASQALGQPLTIFLSLNSIAEHGLGEGSPVRIRILGDRIRIFDK